ncbi:MAG: hypothetical protein JJV98_02840 [Desulfosarcina sp.]|nr:hypothetical protein [Desulfobacterales bacterium]
MNLNEQSIQAVMNLFMDQLFKSTVRYTRQDKMRIRKRVNNALISRLRMQGTTTQEVMRIVNDDLAEITSKFTNPKDFQYKLKNVLAGKS